MRKLLGVVIGAAIAGGAFYGLTLLDHRLFGWPDADFRDRAAFAASIAAAPMTAQAMIAGASFIAALAGGLIAVRIAGWAWAGWIVAGITAAVGLAIVLVVPHPLWMQIAAVAAPLLAGVVVSGASGAA
ncbi:MAG: hypothetical protein WDN44_08165 [Sphingomonas sp.]